MEHLYERLQELKVADCMNTTVVLISVNQCMHEAAQLLRKHDISGAPVVDEHGRCVGMLSASDFVRREADERNGMPPSAYAKAERAEDARPIPLEVGEIGEERVSKYMSPAVQTVTEDTPLVKAAQMMCAEHIHRLPVLDATGRLQGMITSLDVTAALVHAMQEAQQDNRHW